MITRETLIQQIKDILIQQNGNIRITDHPQLRNDAASIGIIGGDLSSLITHVDKSIDWHVFQEVDEKLSNVLNSNKGVIGNKDAQTIVEEVKDRLKPENTISYLLEKVRKLEMKPRDRYPLDWNSFINPWMTDAVYERQQPVTWLDEKATSLEQLGEISYRKIEETKYAIRNTNALPPLITYITKNSASNEEYTQIIQQESDLEKRYLKIIYHLNPSLPFRFKGKEYTDLKLLLNDASASADSFWALVTVFKNQYMHIWLQESGSPEVKKLLPQKTELVDFLQFLYKIDNSYPFYLQNHKYDSPLALAEEARQTSIRWFDIANAIDNRTLGIWLKETGYDIVSTQAKISTYLSKAANFNDEERRKSMVQGFINTVVATAPLPTLTCNTTAISLPSLEAGKPYQQVIDIQLSGEGFVKAAIHIENAVPGITVNTTHLVFHSQEAVTQHNLTLTIDPLLLIKNKQYECSIVITTMFENMTIPAEIKTVFPKKAFAIQLIKYSVIMALFFGIIRYMMNWMMPEKSELYNRYVPFDEAFSMPFWALILIIPSVLLILGLRYSVTIIKKVEKIK